MKDTLQEAKETEVAAHVQLSKRKKHACPVCNVFFHYQGLLRHAATCGEIDESFKPHSVKQHSCDDEHAREPSEDNQSDSDFISETRIYLSDAQLKVVWSQLREMGWSWVYGTRRCQLPTWYYVRPGKCHKTGKLGRDYFNNDTSMLSYVNHFFPEMISAVQTQKHAPTALAASHDKETSQQAESPASSASKMKSSGKKRGRPPAKAKENGAQSFSALQPFENVDVIKAEGCQAQEDALSSNGSDSLLTPTSQENVSKDQPALNLHVNPVQKSSAKYVAEGKKPRDILSAEHWYSGDELSKSFPSAVPNEENTYKAVRVTNALESESVELPNALDSNCSHMLSSETNVRQIMCAEIGACTGISSSDSCLQSKICTGVSCSSEIVAETVNKSTMCSNDVPKDSLEGKAKETHNLQMRNECMSPKQPSLKSETKKEAFTPKMSVKQTGDGYCSNGAVCLNSTTDKNIASSTGISTNRWITVAESLIDNENLEKTHCPEAPLFNLFQEISDQKAAQLSDSENIAVDGLLEMSNIHNTELPSHSYSDSCGNSTRNQVRSKAFLQHEEFCDLWQTARSVEADARHVDSGDLENLSYIRGNKKQRGGRQVNGMFGCVQAPFIEQMIEVLNITAQDNFIDVGSGIGQTVAQVAATVGCQSTGIEIDDDRANLADCLFRIFAGHIGELYGSEAKDALTNCVHLIKGDFCDFTAEIGNASVIFCNNAHGWWKSDKADPEKGPSLEMELLEIIVSCCQIGTQLVVLDELIDLSSKSNMFEHRSFKSVTDCVTWSSRSFEVHIYVLVSRGWSCQHCSSTGNQLTCNPLFADECLVCKCKKKERNRTNTKITLISNIHGKKYNL